MTYCFYILTSYHSFYEPFVLGELLVNIFSKRKIKKILLDNSNYYLLEVQLIISILLSLNKHGKHCAPARASPHHHSNILILSTFIQLV